ncbi:hypothetical protein ASPZODRAFT_129014 [Penicilliopsis zonata CBS 506.65]|uniref:Uncharacterized protein n=1 Tax=Penicilliopsis zonata CBS 506.65 TaxID=1073090 RepID=A0A1L9STI5_9EURO|nr:hypothetical protein ASPZODRAFT_129014 [Penicilliopsis zonata CBS 506.65]OJJ50397.1 hypothetical protein ASPZODRAFT_129014 [Penicilliopsis zonata CBS 506.65]
MRLFLALCCLLGVVCRAQAKAVFAHYLMGNTATFGPSDWETDIQEAQAAGIDAFALDVGSGDNVALPLQMGFETAAYYGFKMFFSFDYSGGTGTITDGSSSNETEAIWPKDNVTALIKAWSSSDAYYTYQGKPLVSTFEGPASADDWTDIKNETGCLFIPDWTSIGPKAALKTGVVDGLFYWGGWPWGPESVNTTIDKQYMAALAAADDNKPYIMPISPWFYTNMPGYDKNWVWNGDNLWYDRWQQALDLSPDFLEIISWNDFGESHYIGPLHTTEYAQFKTADSPYNYAANMPHDGWRAFLPYLIAQYKTGNASLSQESLMVWYRAHPVADCTTGNTTGNAISQGQTTMPPKDILQDRIFFSALLNATADINVTINGNPSAANWTNTPSSSSSSSSSSTGIYHGSAPFDSHTGAVNITLTRNNKIVAQLTGIDITPNCTDDIQNYNAWVGSVKVAESGAARLRQPLSCFFSTPLLVPGLLLAGYFYTFL